MSSFVGKKVYCLYILLLHRLKPDDWSQLYMSLHEKERWTFLRFLNSFFSFEITCTNFCLLKIWPSRSILRSPRSMPHFIFSVENRSHYLKGKASHCSCFQNHSYSHIIFYSLTYLGVGVLTLQVNSLSTVSEAQVHHNKYYLLFTKIFWFHHGTLVWYVGNEIWFLHIPIFIYPLI